MIEKNALERRERKLGKRDIRPLAAFISVFASLCAIFLLTGVSPFGSKSVLMSDLSAQYAPFMVTMRNKILHGSSPYYSFDSPTPLHRFKLAKTCVLLLGLEPYFLRN